MKKTVKYIDVGKMSRKQAEKLVEEIQYILIHKKGSPIEPK